MPLTLLSASKVTFLFDGLFFFAFNDYDPVSRKWRECQVGVHPLVPHHPFRIVIKDTVWNETILDITEPCHKVSRLLNNLIIEESDRGGEERRITRHDASINRMNRVNNQDSFNWVIDFENHELHGKELNKQSSKLKPILRFKAGDFYTAQVSYCKQILKRTNSSGEVSREFGYVARLIGADINLDPGRALVLRMGEQTLRLAGNNEEPTSIYSIKLFNTDDTDSNPNSDVRFFYDHFLSDPNGTRFEFIPVDPHCDQDRDEYDKVVPPYVCYGTTGSRTNYIP
jgi:hypothetical protein